jgi:hypothetical protein
MTDLQAFQSWRNMTFTSSTPTPTSQTPGSVLAWIYRVPVTDSAEIFDEPGATFNCSSLVPGLFSDPRQDFSTPFIIPIGSRSTGVALEEISTTTGGDNNAWVTYTPCMLCPLLVWPNARADVEFSLRRKLAFDHLKRYCSRFHPDKLPKQHKNIRSHVGPRIEDDFCPCSRWEFRWCLRFRGGIVYIYIRQNTYGDHDG